MAERGIDAFYDKEADVLYLSVGEQRPALSNEIEFRVLLRVDPQTGEIVGITIVDFLVWASSPTGKEIFEHHGVPASLLDCLEQVRKNPGSTELLC